MMGVIQALAMARNLAQGIADFGKQAQTANGSRLAEVMNAIASLSDRHIGMIDLAKGLIESDRDEMTPEERQLVSDADNAARDAQQRVLAAMNDESGDTKEQASRRAQERQKAREDQKGDSPELKAAHKAAEERGKSR